MQCQGKEERQEYWEFPALQPVLCALGVPKPCHASALGVPKAVSLLIPWVSPNRVTASTMGVPMPCHS